MIKFSDMDVCQRFVHKDKNKIFVYIERLYSKESPLNNIQNLSERKREAAQQAKLNLKDTEVINMMDLQNEAVNKLIFAYLSSYQNSNSFHKLCSDQQLFWDIQSVLMSPVATSDEEELMKKYKARGELSKTSDELLMRINRLYSEIYAQEDVRDIAVNHIVQMLRPEQRIKMRETISISNV